jgi:hypothetical protein
LLLVDTMHQELHQIQIMFFNMAVVILPHQTDLGQDQWLYGLRWHNMPFLNTVRSTFGPLSRIQKSGLNGSTGGTITTSGSYKIHTFTTSGTTTANYTFTAVAAGNIEILVLGGGGGGAAAFAGGGGAGGAVYSASYPITAGTHSVQVGGGGPGGFSWYDTDAYPNGMQGIDGGDSYFGSLVAKGGGGGGQFGGSNDYPPLAPARPGGCGGGGGSWHASNTTSDTYLQNGWRGAASNQQSFANATSYGFAGGDGWKGYPGGGGGGLGGVGGNGGGSNYGNVNVTGGPGGNGGPGRIFSITGSNVYYGGGGGGSSQSTGFGTGGVGGGGNGKNTNAANQEELKGTDGLGGGGGSSGWPGNAGIEGTRVGGRGGSGIVIVKYAI